MRFYRLSEFRVRRVINSPKRAEEGVAPRTVAMMQPASVKISAGRQGSTKKETWNQEIWAMIQDEKGRRKVISAWRYPGMSKARDETTSDFIKKEYSDYKTRGGDYL
ncbi:MAG: hypothetical protein AAB655_00230 [Patescibacteria group bacterium]